MDISFGVDSYCLDFRLELRKFWNQFLRLSFHKEVFVDWLNQRRPGYFSIRMNIWALFDSSHIPTSNGVDAYRHIEIIDKLTELSKTSAFIPELSLTEHRCMFLQQEGRHPRLTPVSMLSAPTELSLAPTCRPLIVNDLSPQETTRLMCGSLESSDDTSKYFYSNWKWESPEPRSVENHGWTKPIQECLFPHGSQKENNFRPFHEIDSLPGRGIGLAITLQSWCRTRELTKS